MGIRPGIILFLAVMASTTGAWTSSAFAASEYVVVAVDPPADSPALGKLYRPGDLLRIDHGTTVTLMGDDGSVSVLPGPADILVTDDPLEAGTGSKETTEGSSRLSALSDLLTNAGAQIHSIGASRSTSDSQSPRPEPWAIPVEDGSRGCVHDRRLELSREPGGRVAVSVGYDDLPHVAGLVWEDGSRMLAVPGPMPPNVESVDVKIDERSFRMTIEHLPADVSSGDYLGLYAWMIGSGCLHQASALIRQLAGRDGSR